MVGKLTWYKATSSIICALMDEGKYFNKQTCLKRAIDDKHGIPSDFKSTNRMATGDLLEPVLIKEAARRLGITDIDADMFTDIISIDKTRKMVIIHLFDSTNNNY